MKKVKGVYCAVVFLVIVLTARAQNINRLTFYKALSGNSEVSIQKELSRLDVENGISFVNAYKGALLMKKATFVKGPANKVKVFKSGALLLEDEIQSNPKNTEYRFLRLSVQENAPKVLKYNKDLNADRKLILEGYKKLDPDLKKVVKDYATRSGVLKIEDLQ